MKDALNWKPAEGKRSLDRPKKRWIDELNHRISGYSELITRRN